MDEPPLLPFSSLRAQVITVLNNNFCGGGDGRLPSKKNFFIGIPEKARQTELAARNARGRFFPTHTQKQASLAEKKMAQKKRRQKEIMLPFATFKRALISLRILF